MKEGNPPWEPILSETPLSGIVEQDDDFASTLISWFRPPSHGDSAEEPLLDSRLSLPNQALSRLSGPDGTGIPRLVPVSMKTTSRADQDMSVDFEVESGAAPLVGNRGSVILMSNGGIDSVDYPFVLTIVEGKAGVKGGEGSKKRPASGISLVPSLPEAEIVDMKVETEGETGRGSVELEVAIRRRTPIIGWLLLLLALYSISSAGAFLDEMADVPANVKAFWRVTSTLLFLTPITLASAIQTGQFPPAKLSFEDWVAVLACGIGLGVWTGSLVVSLSMTSISHAYMFNNSISLILVFLRLVTCQNPGILEVLGACLGALGAGLSLLDTSSPTSDSSTVTSLWGDLVALLGAGFGVLYVTLAKRLRSKHDLFIVMWLVQLVSCIAQMLAAMCVTAPSAWISRNAHDGLWGWTQLSWNRMGVVVYLGVVSGIMGKVGMVAVMRYFSPVLVTIVLLLEPLIANVVGVALGVAKLAGLMTWVGASVVFIGTSLVALSERITVSRHSLVFWRRRVPQDCQS